MLIITRIDSSDQAVTLRLEGRVIGQWSTVARRVLEETVELNKKVILHMDGVSFLDREGILLFRELARRDVHLLNCSPFLIEQLREPRIK